MRNEADLAGGGHRNIGLAEAIDTQRFKVTLTPVDRATGGPVQVGDLGLD